MQIKKGYILYIDILGYRNILKNNSIEENKKIRDILEKFSGFCAESNIALGYGSKFQKDKLLIRSFSDNFLFVYESDENDYDNLVILQLIATNIQQEFLKVGLLTRGSISYGEIEYTSNLVFGVDLIKAVELEENHKMPCIVVDSKLKSVLEKWNIKYKEEIDLFSVWADSKPDYEDCLNGIKQYLSYLNKSYADENILQKVKWVIDKFNEHFESKQKKRYKLVISFKYNLEIY